MVGSFCSKKVGVTGVTELCITKRRSVGSEASPARIVAVTLTQIKSILARERARVKI